MQIIEKFTTNNENYKSGRRIAVKGLMIHSVGTPQPDPEVFARIFNDPSGRPNGRQVGVHAFAGSDGKVIQTLPWDYRAWHCGSGSRGSGNDTHIGVELTEPRTIKYTGGASFTDNDPANTKAFVMATYKVGVDLFAHLCTKFNLNPLADGVIISHAEGCKRGIASNHGDVEHLWKFFGLTMDQFRQDIQAAMTGASPAVPPPPAPDQTVSPAPAPAIQPDKTVPFNLMGRRLDIPGVIRDGRTFAHVRPLLEGLGFEVGLLDGVVEVRAGGGLKPDSARKINVTPEELTILQKIVHAEARGEDEIGQILVVNVIFNRVRGKGFPDTIKEVVFQKNQFEPTRNGAYEAANPGPATINAVNKALTGLDYSKGALFFMSRRAITAESWHERALTRLFDHGGHRFYK